MQAVNGSAQSVPSDSVFFTVPPVATRAVAGPVSAPAELAPIEPNGNGNGNGKANGNGSRAAVRLS